MFHHTLQRIACRLIVCRAAEHDRLSTFAVHREVLIVLSKLSQYILHRRSRLALEQVSRIEVIVDPFGQPVGNHLVSFHFLHRFLQFSIQIGHGSATHLSFVRRPRHRLRARQEHRNLRCDVIRTAQSSKPRPRTIAVLHLAQSVRGRSPVGLDLVVRELEMLTEFRRQFNAIECDSLLIGRTIHHLHPTRHHFGHFFAGVSARVGLEGGLHTFFQHCREPTTRLRFLFAERFARSNRERHGPRHLDLAREYGNCALLTIAKFIVTCRHTNKQALASIGHAHGETLREHMPVIEAKFSVERVQNAFVGSVFYSENVVPGGRLPTDVAHRDGPFHLVSFAQTARHRHFCSELFARDDRFVERSRIQFPVMCKGIELPLGQTLGQCEVKCGHPRFVRAQSRLEEGRFREIRANLRCPGLEHFSLLAHGASRHRPVAAEYLHLPHHLRGGTVKRHHTERSHSSHAHSVVAPVIEHRFLPNRKDRRGYFVGGASRQTAIERRVVPLLPLIVGER